MSRQRDAKEKRCEEKEMQRIAKRKAYQNQSAKTILVYLELSFRLRSHHRQFSAQVLGPPKHGALLHRAAPGFPAAQRAEHDHWAAQCHGKDLAHLPCV